VAFKAHQLQRAGDQLVAAVCGDILVAQAEIEILSHGFPWKQREMLKHDGAIGAGSVTLRPLSVTDPLLGRSNPATMRRQVVLPQPEGPTMATNSFSAISRLIPRYLSV